jgi:hypothetical protein
MYISISLHTCFWNQHNLTFNLGAQKAIQVLIFAALFKTRSAKQMMFLSQEAFDAVSHDILIITPFL